MMSKTKSGYYQFTKNGKTQLVHRVIATMCLPNPENKPEVNHINGDKLDNRISNLEWVTASENRKHAVKIGVIPTKIIIDDNGQIFLSKTEACQFHNISQRRIQDHFYGRVDSPKYRIIKQ